MARSDGKSALTPRRLVGKVFQLLGVKTLAHDAVNSLPRPLKKIAVRTGVKRELVPRERLMDVQRAGLQWLMQDGSQKIGDYVEFGVYQGTALSCFHDASAAVGMTKMRLFGFDSFEGLPASAAGEDLGVWQPGQFASSLDYTRAYLEHRNVSFERVNLIKGWFSSTATPETAVHYNISRASFVMIDCDLYSSTVDALRFLEPLLHDRVVMIFDDWDSYGIEKHRVGERKAFEEYLDRHPYWHVLEKPTYQDWSRVFYLTDTRTMPI